MPGRPRYLTCFFGVLVSVLICVQGAWGASTAPSMTFYVPFPEADALNALDTINAAAVAPVTTYISIAAIADGTTIYYDQWEDGYEKTHHLPTPVQSTTQIWGDGNPANGAPPGIPSDIINAGTVILLFNTVDPASPLDFDYDARDKIVSTRAIAVTRTYWATESSTLMAGSVETFDTSKWGTDYRVPVGQNIPDGASANDGAHQMFSYTALSIMAAESGTVVRVDADANGTYETTNTLQEGQCTFVNGGVNVGARVLSTKPVQVLLFTGDVGSNYESRDSTLLPVSFWSSSYFTPVATASGDGTRVWLYNPGASTITVNYRYRVGSSATVTTNTSTTVGAGSYASVLLTDNSGTEFYTTGSPAPVFYAYSTTDSDSSDTDDNQAWDWSFTLIPRQLLTPQVLVGLGIGRDPNSGTNPTENGNPIWVTTVGNGQSNATVYVDFDGDNAGPFTDLNGNHYDTNYVARELQPIKIYDPDGDQTALLIYVLSTNISLAAAWGQDPATASASAPGLDVGTAVPPVDVFDVSKSLSLVNDSDADGQLSPGERAKYTIDIGNTSRAPVPADIIVQDIVPEDTTYVSGSTAYRTSTNGSWIAIADNGTGTPFPLDGAGYRIAASIPVDGIFSVQFQVDVDTYSNLTAGRVSIVNTGTVTAVVYNRKLDFKNETYLHGSLGDRVWRDADGDGIQDAGETGMNGVIVYLDSNTNGVRDANERFETTAGDGLYLFTNALIEAGSHVVRIDTTSLPAGYTATFDLDGTSTVNQATVTLAAGQDRLDVDFGYRLPPPPLQIVKSTKVGALVPNETNTYTIVVSNTGTVTQTGIQITDLMPATMRYVPNSTVVVGYKGSGAGSMTNTALDTFENVAYTNNVGSTNWLGNWTETADDGSASAGRVYISGGRLTFQQLNNDSIYRSVNLSNATNAVLTLDWESSSLESAQGDYVAVQVSSNNAAPWTEVLRVNDAIALTGSLTTNITALIGANTTVRFYYGGALMSAANDLAYFDNVQIRFIKPGQASGLVTNDNIVGGAYTDLVDGIPPDLVETGDGFSLATGKTMTVTFRAIVTNSLPPGVTNIINTAGVRSDQYPVWIYSTVTNPVATAARIGDFVWVDANGNGQQDDGAGSGLSNVTVRLYNTNNVVLATVTSTVAGAYAFTNLTAGTYTVRFFPPASYLFTTSNVGLDASDSDPLAGTNRTALITLTSGQTDNTVDAGFYLPASLSGFVRVDLNGNGVVEPLDTNGIASVTVHLLDAASNIVATTTTAGNGSYSFTNLRPGVYTVRETDLTGWYSTTDIVSPNDNLIPVTLVSGQNSTNNNFHDTQYAAIGDFTWVDANGNGQQDDGGGSALANVTVRLYDTNNVVLATVTSSVAGAYAFTGLTAGSYTVGFSPPASYLFTTSDVGADATDSDPLTGTNRTALITLTSGQTDDTIDAGFFLLASLSGFVRVDLNANGVAEALDTNGIAGVTVQLLDGSLNVIATTTTAGDGSYSFTDLRPGAYTVRETDLAGWYSTTDIVAPNDNMIPVTLVSGQSSTGNNFHDAQNATIGDFVWVDANGNGQQGDGEVGLSNVVVRLYDTNNVVLATTTSTVAGAYSFTNLPPGAYQVQFDARSGYYRTLPDQGNDASDSDANVTTGLTPAFTLTSGQSNNTIDAGYQAVAVGDFVWTDVNANGIQDVNEPGISNVVVQVYTSAGLPYQPRASLGTFADDFDTAGGTNGSDGTLAWAADWSASNNATVVTNTGTDYEIRIADTANSTMTRSFVAPAGTDRITIGFDYRQGNGNDTVSAQWSTNGTVWNTLATYNTGASGTGTTNFTVTTTPGTSYIRFSKTALGGAGGGSEFMYFDNVTILAETAPVTIITTTDANGYYWFGPSTGLVSGTSYQLRVATNQAPLAGLALASQNQGGDDALDSDASLTNAAGFATILFTAPVFGGSDQTLDFGFKGTAALGDRVWLDQNGNGVQDLSENGVTNITVRLLNAASNVITTTTTDITGAYLFANLLPATYLIEFVAPTQHVFTVRDAIIATDLTDSDPDQATGRTAPIVVTAGTTNLTVDAGLFRDVPTAAAVLIRAYGTADGVVVEFQSIEEAGGKDMILYLFRDGRWVEVGRLPSAGEGNHRYVFQVPGLKAGDSCNLMVRDDEGQYHTALGITVGTFAAEAVLMEKNGLWLQWASLPDRTYEIRRTERLGGTWLVVKTVTAIDFQTRTFVSFEPGQPSGFFKIVMQP
jgi:uncharacterized repeat protein (TIGR01451 family)